jgi:peptidoglycan/LPS O-acetylase OafA/YrhL
MLRPFTVFGRVPFFFYVVHFYVLALARGALRAKVGVGETYAIWILLLLVMAVPCAWYFKKKQERPNWLTGYL